MEYFMLNNNINIPALGIGTFTLAPTECEEVVRCALDTGYRLIDTANMYKNEKAVGRAIKKSGVPRKEIFITTKLWPTCFPYEKAKQAIEDSLRRLGTDYIDLLLLHQEVGDVKGAWRAMEEAVRAGEVKSIGVSNFSRENLDKLLETATILPAIVQNECHPYLQEKAFKQHMSEKNIRMQAWYPLGHGDLGLIMNPLFSELSQQYGKTNAQIILRWHIQAGNVAIPCSRKPEHIKENFDIWDFEISDEDMQKISGINSDKRYFKMPAFIKQIAFTRGNIDFDDQV